MRFGITVCDGKTIDDLRISVTFQQNSVSQTQQIVQFEVPIEFLKLCRFLMYANSVSSRTDSYFDFLKEKYPRKT
jgi:hypothetical protein